MEHVQFCTWLNDPDLAQLSGPKPYLGTVGATQLVGVVCFSLAAIGLYGLRESFAVDLNFLELLRPANSIPEEETEEVRFIGNL